MNTNTYEITLKIEFPEQMTWMEVNRYMNDKLSKMFSDNPGLRIKEEQKWINLKPSTFKFKEVAYGNKL